MTTLEQLCSVVAGAEGAPAFVILTGVVEVAEGDLPREGAAPYTASIFVHKVVVGTDPKQDAFLRVANVLDMTTVSLTRSTTVGALYRSNTCSLTYPSIVAATQAKPLILQRVDNLVADWRKYAYEFLGLPTAAPSPPPSSYITDSVVPLVDGEVATRQAAYAAAHAALVAAQTAQATAATAYTDAQDAAAAAASDSSSAAADSAACLSVKADNDAAAAALATFLSAVTAFKAAVDASTDTGLVTARNTFAAAQGTYAAAGTPHASATTTAINAQCVTKASEATAAATALQTANSNLGYATTAKQQADAAATAAAIADNNAYLSLKEVCPDAEALD